jgi:hypothetical protein
LNQLMLQVYEKYKDFEAGMAFMNIEEGDNL